MTSLLTKDQRSKKANNSTIDYEFDRNLEDEEKSVTELFQLLYLAVEQLLTVQGRVSFNRDPVVRDTDRVQRTMLNAVLLLTIQQRSDSRYGMT